MVPQRGKREGRAYKVIESRGDASGEVDHRHLGDE
jgi:hypothetical protein